MSGAWDSICPDCNRPRFTHPIGQDPETFCSGMKHPDDELRRELAKLRDECEYRLEALEAKMGPLAKLFWWLYK